MLVRELVKNQMQALGYNVKTTSYMTGISEVTIYRLLSGRPPTFDTLLALRDKLGIDLALVTKE